jgi:hypothetical protein
MKLDILLVENGHTIRIIEKSYERRVTTTLSSYSTTRFSYFVPL